MKPAPVLFFLALVIIGWLGLLLRVTRIGKPAIDGGTSYTLRHSALLRWFSLVALFGGETLFGFWVAIVPPQDEKMLWLLGIGAVLLAILGFALMWESYRWQLIVTPATLDCRSPWKPRRLVNRTEIASVIYSPMNGWHVLRFTNGGSFRIPSVVPGAARFVNECNQQIIIRE